MKRATIGAAALGATALVTLTGCVSASNGESAAAPASVSATPLAQQKCDLFAQAQLETLFKQGFLQPTIDAANTNATTTACQWTVSSQEGLVLTKVVTAKAAKLYDESKQQSARTLGIVEDIKVPGADKAFELASLGRTTMLVGDSLVEVSVLIPTATSADVHKAAELAARHASVQ
jgi:Protein of unknown function (DUF3558)